MSDLPGQVRAYVDTSVFGGVFDEEFAAHSQAFFLRVERGLVRVLLGETTERELRDAPEEVRAILDLLPPAVSERCPPTPQIDALADAYLAAGVVGPRWRQDAIQVATATVYGADVLVSWNYKHIVRFDRVRGFHSVNVRLGYPLVYIASPAEVQLGDEGEEV